MSSTTSGAPKRAADNTFLTEARAALRQAVSQHVPLSVFTWQPAHKQETYQAGTMAVSFPFIDAGISLAALEDAYTLNTRDPLNRMRSTLATFKDATICEMRAALLKQEYQPGQPHIHMIPKLKYSNTLPALEGVADALYEAQYHFHEPVDLNDPKSFRPLHIAQWKDKSVQNSLNLMFSSYLASRWKPHVVGFRAGISIPTILVSLERAMAATGRRVVLLADVEDFFGSIPRGRVLNVLDGETGYRKDPLLASLLHQFVSPNGVGLPQGSPLSPLLANLYGADCIDTYWQAGPLMRYADDLAVVVESVAGARRLYADMSSQLQGHGLRLHPRKSMIVDFATGRIYRPDGTEIHETVLYLGVELAWREAEQQFEYRMANKSIRKLLQGLKDVLSDQEIGPEEAETAWLCRWSTMRLKVIGWLLAFQVAEMSAEQAQVLKLGLHACGLTREALRNQVEWCKFFHDDPAALLAKIAAAMNLDEKDAEQLTWDSIEPLGVPLDAYLAKRIPALKRFREAPLRLPYKERGKTAYTTQVTVPLKDDGFIYTPSDPAIWSTPVPQGDLVLRSWSPSNNWFGGGALPTMDAGSLF